MSRNEPRRSRTKVGPLPTCLYGLERTIAADFLGDVGTGDLFVIWNSGPYVHFREKVRSFDFSPYHACGGCLWAQGVIQCP